MPPYIEWVGHIVHDSVSHQRRHVGQKAAIVFYVELSQPERLKGRKVRIELGHELVVAALINQLVQQLRETGKHLPQSMG